MRKVVFFLLISFSTYAQKFVAEAPLGKVEKTGFYEIPLPPRITALMTDGFENLRIIDEKSVQVPYVVRRDQSEYTNVEWKEFKIEKEARKGCCTVITILNEDKTTIDNFLLQVKNADVQKTAILRGSDDRKTWYALKENFNLDFGNVNGKVVTEVFDFPLSDYAFYQLTINDSTTSPLNVVSAWQVAANVVRGRYVEIPSVRFSVSESKDNYESSIDIKLDTIHLINKLEFKVSGPHLYKREAEVLLKAEYFDGKIKKGDVLSLPIGTFEIISGQAPLVLVDARGQDLVVRIKNLDDQPLKIEEVRAFQLKQSVTAWLEEGHQYKLAFTNDLRAPDYDLKYFKDSIPANPPVIEVEGIKRQQEEPEVATSGTPTFFTNRNIIWIAIFLVIAILGFMSVRMLREKNTNP